MCEVKISSETYKVLPGAQVDYGGRYEYLTASYVSHNLLQIPEIINFKLANNDSSFGYFDDLVFEMTLQNGSEQTWAVQLKHTKTKKIISKNELASVGKGDFSISKYFEDYKSRRHHYPDHTRFVLYSNRHLDSEKEFEISNKPFIFKTLRAKDGFGPLDTSGNACIYQLNVRLKDGEADQEELELYEEFFAKFYIYSDQKNVNGIEQEISQIFAEVYESDGQEKYKKFFETWCRLEQENDVKYKLTKREIQLELRKILLEPHIKPVSRTKSNARGELLKNVIAKFDVTVVACEESLLENLWNSSSSLETWDRDDTPFIVKLNESNRHSVLKAIDLCRDRAFLLISGCIDSSEFNSLRVFRNLADLEDEDCTEVAEHFSCVIQGRPNTPLVQVLADNEKLKSCFAVEELFRMVAEKSFVIGDYTVELPIPYISRSIPKQVLSLDLIKNVTSDVLIISCDIESDWDKLKDAVQKLKHSETVVLVRNDMEFEVKLKKAELDHQLIILSQAKYSKIEFTKICEVVKTDRNIHYLQFNERYLGWMNTKGDKHLLRSFLMSYNEEKVHDSDILTVCQNKLNVLLADPGMGKSICGDFFKLNSKFTFWPIKINLRENLALFRNWAGADTLVEKILASEVRQDDSTRKFFDFYKKKKRLLLIWDGFDEVGNVHWREILNGIEMLSNFGYRQWITSRLHLKTELEEFFDVFSVSLTEITLDDQQNYIKERLEKVYENDIENVTANIYKRIENSTLKTMLGIPLLLYMFTQICMDKSNYLKILHSDFSLIHVYGMFVDGQFDHYINKFSEENTLISIEVGERKKDRIVNYQKASLKITFDEDFVTGLNESLNNPELNNCDEFLTSMKDGDIYGIITRVSDDCVPVFIHKTFAEYFSALFLSRKFRQLDQKTLEKLFQPQYKTVRLLFDMVLSKEFPAHLAALEFNLERLRDIQAKNPEEIWLTDDGGRNVLHLVASYGTRYPPLVETTPRQVFDSYKRRKIPRKIFKAVPLDTIEKENKTYKMMIQFLLESMKMDKNHEFSLMEMDQVYRLNTLEYADIAMCLYALVEVILAIADTKKPFDFSSFKVYTDIETVLTYSVIIASQNVLLFWQNVPNFELANEGVRWYDVNFYNQLCDFEKYNILLMMITYNRADMLEEALKIRNCIGMINDQFNGVNSLSWAVRQANLDVLKVLVRHKADEIQLYRDKSGRNLLHIAAEENKLNVVKYFIDTKLFHIDSHDRYGNTPIIMAAQEGHVEIVEFLIRSGANYFAVDSHGRNILHFACKNENLDLVETLSREDIIALNTDLNWLAETPLIVAAQMNNFEIVSYLIQLGAEVGANKSFGLNVLHFACKTGNLAFVETLSQDDLLALNTGLLDDVEPPVLLAAQNNHFGIVSHFILNSVNVDARNSYGWNILHFACKNGNLNFVKTLSLTSINAFDTADLTAADTPVLLAAQNNYFEIVEHLIENGVKFDARNFKGWNVLHFACEHGRLDFVKTLSRESIIAFSTDLLRSEESPLLIAARNKNFELVSHLIQIGVDISARDFHKWNILHFACENGKLEFVKALSQEDMKVVTATTWARTSPVLVAAQHNHFEIVSHLIEIGVKVGVKNSRGWNILHFACQHGNLDFVKTLPLKYIIAFDTPESYINGFGETPMLLAARNNYFEIVTHLIRNGANVAAKQLKGWNVLHFACRNGNLDFIRVLSRESIIAFDAPDVYGLEETPLLLAARNDNFEIVSHLIRNGANVNATNSKKWNVLHCACKNGNLDFVRALPRKAIVAFDTANDLGETPLLVAARNGNFNVVSHLIQNGANIDAKDSNGWNVLHIACKNGNVRFVGALSREIVCRLYTANSQGKYPSYYAKKYHKDSDDLLEHLTRGNSKFVFEHIFIDVF